MGSGSSRSALDERAAVRRERDAVMVAAAYSLDRRPSFRRNNPEVTLAVPFFPESFCLPVSLFFDALFRLLLLFMELLRALLLCPGFPLCVCVRVRVFIFFFFFFRVLKAFLKILAALSEHDSFPCWYYWLFPDLHVRCKWLVLSLLNLDAQCF